MRKLSFIFLLFISFSSFSQIELVETNQSEIISRISYVYLEKMGETQYNFFYKDMNAPSHEYVSFGFKNLNNDYDKLYQIIMNGFKENPRDPLKIKANGEIVWLKYDRDEGVVKLQVQQFLDQSNSNKMSVSRLLTAEDMKALFKK